MLEFRVGDRLVGPGHPCFIIAEAGVNHNGDLALAIELIDIAAEAKADAVKFQTFSADRLATVDAPKAEYQTRATDANESQYQMLKRLELTAEQQHRLAEHCARRGIIFLSTPFDEEAADLLNELGVAAFKTPSGELTNLDYLAYVAGMRKPMLVSTGMATLDEVSQAVATIERAGCTELALLHCVSNYPAQAADINLRAMQTLSQTFGVPAGYSDHSAGYDIALASVALGACILEKHFTVDRNLEGPDHRASLEPAELVELVRGIRNVEASLGHGRKVPTQSELATASVARKSLVVVQDVPAGSTLTERDIAVKRPGTGLAPAMRSQVIGRKTLVGIPSGTLLSLEMLA